MKHDDAISLSSGDLASAYISILVVNLDYVLLRQTITDNFHIKKEKEKVQQNLLILEPVIRVFGSTPYGQRTCAHIHGVYPYIYFRPENFNHPIFESEAKLLKVLPIFEKSIEDLLHLKRQSMKRMTNNAATTSSSSGAGGNDPGGGYETKRRKHVHHLEMVRKRSIYGMWTEKVIFIKAVLYDPADITKLGSILQEGSLAGVMMEVFESHVPYLMKFTSDNNISTMGWIHMKEVRFRSPLPDLSSLTTSQSTTGTAAANNKEANTFLTPPAVPGAGPPTTTPLRTSGSHLSLTLMSPFKDVAILQERLSALSEDKSAVAEHKTSNTVRFFTMKSVVSKYVWPELAGTVGSGLPPKPPPPVFETPAPTKMIQDAPYENPTTTSSKASYVTSSGIKIEGELISSQVVELFEGLNQEDLIFSQQYDTPPEVKAQQESKDSKQLPPLLPPPPLRPIGMQSTYPKRNNNYNFAKKTSTCELELDTHIAQVLNVTMKKIEFGGDLWEEERIRCQRKNLPFDQAPALPSTQTVYRTQQQTEKNFRMRFSKLQLKGAALRRTARSMLVPSSASPTVPSKQQPRLQKRKAGAETKSEEAKKRTNDFLLSQYLTAEDSLAMRNAESLKRKLETTLSPELEPKADAGENEDDIIVSEPINQWVSQTIDNARKEAEEEEELFHSVVGVAETDPDSLVEDHIRSQTQRSQSIERQYVDNKDSKGFLRYLDAAANNAGEEDDDDAEERDVVRERFSIEQELKDILTSTQLDVPPGDEQQESGGDTKTGTRRKRPLTATTTTDDELLLLDPSPEKDIFQANEIDNTPPLETAATKPPKGPAKETVNNPAPSKSVVMDESPKSSGGSVNPFDSPMESKPSGLSTDLIRAPTDTTAERSSRMHGIAMTQPDPDSATIRVQEVKPPHTQSPSLAMMESLVGKRKVTEKSITSVFKKAKLSPTGEVAVSVKRGVRWKDAESSSSSSGSVLPEGLMEQRPPENPLPRVPATPASTVHQTNQPLGILHKSSEKSESATGLDAASTDTTKEKKRKSVSFGSKVVNISIEQVVPTKERASTPSTNSANALLQPETDRLQPDPEPPENVQDTAITAGFQPPKNEKPVPIEIIELSPSPATQAPSAAVLVPPPPLQKTAGFTKNTGGTMFLSPSFHPPSTKELKPLTEFNLPLVINPVARFSLVSDAKEYLKLFESNQNNSNYNQYMTVSHKVVYEKEVPKFTAIYQPRKTDEEQIISTVKEKKGGSSLRSEKKSLPPRTRCLLPTFLPPSPAKLWKKHHEVKRKAAATKAAASEPLGSPQPQLTSATTQSSGHQHKEESTQSSDSHHVLLGEASEASDKMTRVVILSMELHCKTRKELLPNPKYDPIEMIVWICDDIISNAETETCSRYAGVMMVLSPSYHQMSHSSGAASIDKQLLLRELQMNIRALPVVGPSLSHNQNTKDIDLQVFPNEIELMTGFCDITRNILDPDFLLGFESLSNSYGYLIKRGQQLNLNILQLLSRIPEEKPSFRNTIIRNNNDGMGGGGGPGGGLGGGDGGEEEYYDNNSVIADVGIFVKGRTFLNMWNLLKNEYKLWNSTVQVACETLLQATLPFFSCQQLTKWYALSYTRYKTITYVYQLALCNCLLLEHLDLIRKISECARLYGIDFFSVLHRGSQYRVEAALIPKAHAYDYVLLSPSRTRVANQAAMEVIPLVLEPKSAFYTDPVLVLDYQALYPSMMLTYNLCYSTVMGKLKIGTGPADGNPNNRMLSDTTGRLGVINYPESVSAVNSTLHVKDVNQYLRQRSSPEAMNEQDDAETADVDSNQPQQRPLVNDNTPYVSPNGTIFCAKSVRLGILPMMVKEMLDTRMMVKRAMKKHAKISEDGKKHNKVLEKVLDARQLAIKLLANVTYGYTGAGFSGRMPMAELADAIVQSARSLLEWTIRTINSHPAWKAEVVYGDTDSVFVKLPGRNLQQAFAIGEEIALFITSKTPPEVVLKFEKVYYPSLLISKKRYVGNCYEYPPPAPEILQNIMIDPRKIVAPRPVATHASDAEEYYGKKEIVSLLYKYSSQNKIMNYLFIDAKGIEMIRADQCVITQRIQKDILILLFSTFGNMSLIKSYLLMKWTQILSNSNRAMATNIADLHDILHQHGKSKNQQEELDKLLEVSFKDYVFNKEVRFGTYASVSSQPPGAIVATKEVLQDEMAIPPYGWKVPYIVVYGLPNTPLKNLVYSPKELLKRGSTQHSLRVNYMYYIMKCINPSLDRCLSLCGVNIFTWFTMMTRPKPMMRHMNYDTIPRELLPPNSNGNGNEAQNYPAMASMISLIPGLQAQQQQQMSMEQFILQRQCLICETALARANKLICEKCFKQFRAFLFPGGCNEEDTITSRRGKRNRGFKRQSILTVLKGKTPVIDLEAEERPTEIVDTDPGKRYTHKDMEAFLSFQQKLKILQITNHYYEQICNYCVKDLSYHFHSKHTSSQQLQLYAKNEMLGCDNCGNVGCEIFQRRMKVLYDLEDFTLVSHELKL